MILLFLLLSVPLVSSFLRFLILSIYIPISSSLCPLPLISFLFYRYVFLPLLLLHPSVHISTDSFFFLSTSTSCLPLYIPPESSFSPLNHPVFCVLYRHVLLPLLLYLLLLSSLSLSFLLPSAAFSNQLFFLLHLLIIIHLLPFSASFFFLPSLSFILPPPSSPAGVTKQQKQQADSQHHYGLSITQQLIAR